MVPERPGDTEARVRGPVRLCVMRSETAGGELTAGLERAGVLGGAIDLPAIWPVLSAWWRVPVLDVAPEDDERSFLLSIAPAIAQPGATTFAGRSPDEIAGAELVRIDFDRQFACRVGPRTTVGLPGGAAISLWYASGPIWETVRDATNEWIDLGLSTPHIDAFGDGGDLAAFMDRLERSAAFTTAWRQRALALRVDLDERDDIVVLGSEGT